MSGDHRAPSHRVLMSAARSDHSVPVARSCARSSSSSSQPDGQFTSTRSRCEACAGSKRRTNTMTATRAQRGHTIVTARFDMTASVPACCALRPASTSKSDRCRGRGTLLSETRGRVGASIGNGCSEPVPQVRRVRRAPRVVHLVAQAGLFGCDCCVSQRTRLWNRPRSGLTRDVSRRCNAAGIACKPCGSPSTNRSDY
jgi:hypothetical protein